MTTKYIVNNVSGQTISGDLTIEGNLNVSQSITNESIGVYRALMTQTGSITGINIGMFNSGLIIGEIYTITNYIIGDDFSNIAIVLSGTINETGCVFVATGASPSNWFFNSELTSNGGLIVDVLENTLGYDIQWVYNVVGDGIYIGSKGEIGPYTNSFPRNKTSVLTQTIPINGSFGFLIQTSSGVGSLGYKDDVVFIGVFDYTIGYPINDSLYYTPIEIKINKDLDTTPITINGIVTPSFPFGYVSFNIYCNGNTIETFYSDDMTLVNDIDELVTLLNNNDNTNVIGTFSNDGSGGIIMTIPTNIKNQLCPENTLTFEVFSD